jgi:hypothetical protein
MFPWVSGAGAKGALVRPRMLTSTHTCTRTTTQQQLVRTITTCRAWQQPARLPRLKDGIGCEIAATLFRPFFVFFWPWWGGVVLFWGGTTPYPPFAACTGECAWGLVWCGEG